MPIWSLFCFLSGGFLLIVSTLSSVTFLFKNLFILAGDYLLKNFDLYFEIYNSYLVTKSKKTTLMTGSKIRTANQVI